MGEGGGSYVNENTANVLLSMHACHPHISRGVASTSHKFRHNGPSSSFRLAVADCSSRPCPDNITLMMNQMWRPRAFAIVRRASGLRKVQRRLRSATVTRLQQTWGYRPLTTAVVTALVLLHGVCYVAPLWVALRRRWGACCLLRRPALGRPTLGRLLFVTSPCSGSQPPVGAGALAVCYVTPLCIVSTQLCTQLAVTSPHSGSPPFSAGTLAFTSPHWVAPRRHWGACCYVTPLWVFAPCWRWGTCCYVTPLWVFAPCRRWGACCYVAPLWFPCCLSSSLTSFACQAAVLHGVCIAPGEGFRRPPPVGQRPRPALQPPPPPINALHSLTHAEITDEEFY